MKLQVCMFCALLGCFAASTVVNFQLLGLLRDAPAAANEVRPILDPQAIDCLETLNLTQEQCQQILDCSTTCLDLRSDLAHEAEGMAAELEQLLDREQPDAARVRELASKICELRSKQYQRLVQSVLFLRETLTPEQFTLISNQ